MDEGAIPFLERTLELVSNNASIYQFLSEGVERSKPYEGVYTMGMRGLGDTTSPTITASFLAVIVKAEQQILSQVFNTTNISSIPQMWCLYKEVGGYYAQGLRVQTISPRSGLTTTGETISAFLLQTKPAEPPDQVCTVISIMLEIHVITSGSIPYLSRRLGNRCISHMNEVLNNYGSSTLGISSRW